MTEDETYNERKREQDRLIKNQKIRLQSFLKKYDGKNYTFEEYEQYERVELQNRYGKENLWDTEELKKEFKVLGFLAPFVVVERIKDGIKGSIKFQHSPRFYFDFRAENEEKKEPKTIKDVLGIKNQDDLERYTENLLKRLGFE